MPSKVSEVVNDVAIEVAQKVGTRRAKCLTKAVPAVEKKFERAKKKISQEGREETVVDISILRSEDCLQSLE